MCTLFTAGTAASTSATTIGTATAKYTNAASTKSAATRSQSTAEESITAGKFFLLVPAFSVLKMCDSKYTVIITSKYIRHENLSYFSEIMAPILFQAIYKF